MYRIRFVAGYPANWPDNRHIPFSNPNTPVSGLGWSNARGRRRRTKTWPCAANTSCPPANLRPCPIAQARKSLSALRSLSLSRVKKLVYTFKLYFIPHPSSIARARKSSSSRVKNSVYTFDIYFTSPPLPNLWFVSKKLVYTFNLWYTSPPLPHRTRTEIFESC